MHRRTYLRETPRNSRRAQPKMFSRACWMPGNRPSRALAPVVRASLRRPLFDRAPTISTLFNHNWSGSTVSRAVSLEGRMTAPRRCLRTDTTITYHLSNTKHRYLSQEPACKQQKHAVDGDSPAKKAAAAAESGGGIGRGRTGVRPSTR